MAIIFSKTKTKKMKVSSNYNMKQKVIIQLLMKDQKSRYRALKIVVGVSGVESVALIGAEKDQLQVIGEGIDSVTLTRKVGLLRKKVGHAVLVSVGEAKKEEETEKKAEAPTVMIRRSCTIM